MAKTYFQFITQTVTSTLASDNIDHLLLADALQSSYENVASNIDSWSLSQGQRRALIYLCRCLGIEIRLVDKVKAKEWLLLGSGEIEMTESYASVAHDDDRTLYFVLTDAKHGKKQLKFYRLSTAYVEHAQTSVAKSMAHRQTLSDPVPLPRFQKIIFTIIAGAVTINQLILSLEMLVRAKQLDTKEEDLDTSLAVLLQPKYSVPFAMLSIGMWRYCYHEMKRFAVVFNQQSGTWLDKLSTLFIKNNLSGGINKTTFFVANLAVIAVECWMKILALSNRAYHFGASKPLAITLAALFTVLAETPLFVMVEMYALAKHYEISHFAKDIQKHQQLEQQHIRSLWRLFSYFINAFLMVQYCGPAGLSFSEWYERVRFSAHGDFSEEQWINFSTFLGGMFALNYVMYRLAKLESPFKQFAYGIPELLSTSPTTIGQAIQHLSIDTLKSFGAAALAKLPALSEDILKAFPAYVGLNELYKLAAGHVEHQHEHLIEPKHIPAAFENFALYMTIQQVVSTFIGRAMAVPEQDAALDITEKERIKIISAQKDIAGTYTPSQIMRDAFVFMTLGAVKVSLAEALPKDASETPLRFVEYMLSAVMLTLILLVLGTRLNKVIKDAASAKGIDVPEIAEQYSFSFKNLGNILWDIMRLTMVGIAAESIAENIYMEVVQEEMDCVEASRWLHTCYNKSAANDTFWLVAEQTENQFNRLQQTGELVGAIAMAGYGTWLANRRLNEQRQAQRHVKVTIAEHDNVEVLRTQRQRNDGHFQHWARKVVRQLPNPSGWMGAMRRRGSSVRSEVEPLLGKSQYKAEPADVAGPSQPQRRAVS